MALRAPAELNSGAMRINQCLACAQNIGGYLLSNGDHLPGNTKLGKHVLLRVRSKPVAVSHENYPTLANRVMNGEIPDSSAGEEQPNFTAFSANSASHMIVKFSPKERV